VNELIFSALVFDPPLDCEMGVLKEQRVCIKFSHKHGKTATETYEMLQAFEKTALSGSKTFEWYSRFKNGRPSIDVDPHTGRPFRRTNGTVDRVSAVISRNRRSERLLTNSTCHLAHARPHRWS
jgi:hypothetical protein